MNQIIMSLAKLIDDSRTKEEKILLMLLEDYTEGV